ncbi:MAG: IS5/IS1182 family transposase, partial [Cyanobacteria bacterium P01_H01_bin.58]
MSDLYWLSDEQMGKLSPLFPKPHGKPRVDDRG